MAAYRRVYDSHHLHCRLTAKNRDQLRNPTLGCKTLISPTVLFKMCVLQTVAMGSSQKSQPVQVKRGQKVRKHRQQAAMVQCVRRSWSVVNMSHVQCCVYSQTRLTG